MRESETYASLATTDQITPQYLDLLREMIVDDASCPIAYPLARNETGSYLPVNSIPSPLHWSRQMEWPWAILEAELEPTHHVLDVGGSWAVNKYAIARRVESLWSIDTDATAIEKTRHTIERLGFHGKIIQHTQDVRDMYLFNAESFHRVFCLSVLEHVENDHIQAIDEMIRVLKPGGVLLLTMDVLLEGSHPDFHLSVAGVCEVLRHLGIADVNNKLETVCQLNEQTHLCCMLVRWKKPETL